MKADYRAKSIEYIRNRIKYHETEIANLSADLQVVSNSAPNAIPIWQGMVSSAWHSEGEPSWEGTVQALDVREAVYKVMMAFCQKVGRVYPGYKSPISNKTYSNFDLQGTIYLRLLLPHGTKIPVEEGRLEELKRQFNTKAPMPPKPQAKKPVGLT